MGTVDGRLTLMRIQRTTSALWRHDAWLAQVRVGGMGRNEGLCLRGNGREYTLLLETLAVGAATILGSIKTRAADLGVSSALVLYPITTDHPPCDGDNTGRLWRSVV